MSHRSLSFPAPRLVALCVATVALAALAAGCGNGGNDNENVNGNGGVPPTTTAAAPMTVPPASTTATVRYGAAPPTTTASVMTGSMSGSFVAKAATGSMLEIKLADIAMDKSNNDDVKDFANKIKSDHTEANNKLKSIAQQEGLAVPTDLTAEQKSTVDKLQGKSGAEFDKAYAQTMVEDHQKAIKLFQDAAQNASTPQLRQFAQNTVPTLQTHLDMAQSLQSKVANEKPQ
ncbi:MAG TPA: DUF4142 domain-containing protein [Rhodanobacteraceae bacterium]|nr:DUF4142 domain-containing protein [Rhodanobacteraceae bacterium]